MNLINIIIYSFIYDCKILYNMFICLEKKSFNVIFIFLLISEFINFEKCFPEIVSMGILFDFFF